MINENYDEIKFLPWSKMIAISKIPSLWIPNQRSPTGTSSPTRKKIGCATRALADRVRIFRTFGISSTLGILFRELGQNIVFQSGLCKNKSFSDILRSNFSVRLRPLIQTDCMIEYFQWQQEKFTSRIWWIYPQRWRFGVISYKWVGL